MSRIFEMSTSRARGILLPPFFHCDTLTGPNDRQCESISMENRSSDRKANIITRPLKNEDLMPVIKIHVEFFGSPSGTRFLEKAYYPAFFLPQSTGFGFVAVSKRQITGFCLGALDSSAFHRTLLRSHTFECLTAALRLASVGKEIRNGLSYPFRQLFSSPVNLPGGRIFFIAVRKNFQQKGIASRLVTEALDHCRSHRLKRCWSRTPKSNAASYGLHTRLGFCVHPEMSKRDPDRFVFYADLRIPASFPVSKTDERG